MDRDIRPGPDLPRLRFQADCGSVKGAEVPAEEDTEHYLPCCTVACSYRYK